MYERRNLILGLIHTASATLWFIGGHPVVAFIFLLAAFLYYGSFVGDVLAELDEQKRNAVGLGSTER